MELHISKKHGEDGSYRFELVEIEQLANYYVEFEYDGLIFQNVPEYNMSTWNAKEQGKYTTDYAAHEVANASKAAEHSDIRTGFNKKFKVIEGNGTPDGGVAKNGEGNELSLKYFITEKKKSDGITEAELDHSIDGTKIESGQYLSTGKTNTDYLIKADTYTANYNINEHFIAGETEEITNINLGLERREQADLSIRKDIDNVHVTINGYGHTYKYSQVLANEGKDSEDGFNVGVRYGRAEGDEHYRTAIYKSDYDYTNADNSKELKVYIVYKIKIQNNSSSLHAKVNEIVDYFDSRYELVGAGYELKDDGNLDGTVFESGELKMAKEKNLAKTDDGEPYSKDENYKKVIIDTSGKTMGTIDDNAVNNVYVEFKLNRGAVADILEEKGYTTDEKELLDNAVEINSYSILDANGNVYGALDRNSAPGNAEPPTKEEFAQDDLDPITYENDTNLSPALKLELAEARKMTGTVFLDDFGTEEETRVGEERRGNGRYDEGKEIGIGGVTVTLQEVDETTGLPIDGGQKYPATTKANGDFEIEGYIPGNYKLTYTWGNEKYTVQNYKGTIYDNNRNQNDPLWYMRDPEVRKTDALDDLDTRKSIDKQLMNVKFDSEKDITIQTMDSTTPLMGIGVENKEENSSSYDEYGSKLLTDSSRDELRYIIKNIDFGIIERARQNLELTKRIDTLKLTLASGFVLSDAKIVEEDDGTRRLEEQQESTTYMAPGQNPVNGQIKLELDSELIQGAKLEVTYSIVVTNKSELDYYSETGEYYLYGEKTGDVIKITPTEIIDYLDNDWRFKEETNTGTGWTPITLYEIKQEGSEKVAANVYTNEDSTIKEKQILTTGNLETKNLEPKGTAKISLNVSKDLSTTDEISLDNETEVIEINKTGGSKVQFIPGNYVPGSDPTITPDNDDAKAETTIVTPSTGENRNYIIPITIGIVALIILGIGIVIIKKKVMRD